MAAAGLSVRELGTSVRAAFEGIVATTIRKLDDELDIRVTLGSNYQTSEKTIDYLKIPNKRGQLIPIKNVTTQGQSQGVSSFEHENSQRQVSVFAEVDTAITNSRKVNAIMKERIAKLRTDFPDLDFSFGGEEQDSKESIQGLLTSFVFAVGGILLLMTLLFKNLVQPIMVATTIPLGIVSVIWTFYFRGDPLSFLSIIGIIALAGVIVNNAIVFLDFVTKEKKRGLNRKESVIEAGRKRVRAIILTTITTVVGILPTAYGVGGLDPFVVPIALALGWGLCFGSILTLVIFPPIVVVIEDITGIPKKIKLAFRVLSAKRKG